MPHLSRRRVVEYVGCFRFIFFAPPSRCPHRAKREKQFGFHSSVPTHPTPGHTSPGSSGRRARRPGDGSRCGHPGCRGRNGGVGGGPRSLQCPRDCAPPGRFGARDGDTHAAPNDATPGRSRARDSAATSGFSVSRSPPHTAKI